MVPIINYDDKLCFAKIILYNQGFQMKNKKINVVDYDQIAKYEAAIELINVLNGILLSLQDKYPQYYQLIEDRFSELISEKQKLRSEYVDWVQEIGDTYAPLTRDYYKDPENFNLTKEFIETKTSYSP